ncbi:MAG: oligosaccharide flippase family protein [Cyanobacteria bacterium P01_G01_bin.38]
MSTTFNKLIKGAGLSFFGQIVGTAIKYLTQIMLAWLLGAETFGLYTLGIIIYQLGELFSRMGLETGAIRYISIHHDANDQRRLKGVLLQSMGLPFISGLAFGWVLFLASEPIAQTIFKAPTLTPALRLFALALPFGASATAGIFATTGFQIASYKVFVWEILLPLINLILAFVLCGLGWGLWGATAAWLFALIASLLITIQAIRGIFPNLLTTTLKPIFESKKLLAFSLPLSFGSFLWLVMLWTDALMLGYFRPAAEVGIYRAASQTALLMTLFTRSLVTLFTPMIARLYSTGALEELDKLFSTAARWSFSLTLPLFLILAVAGGDVMSIFGQDFEIGWIPLIILAAGQLARAGPGGFAMHILSMSGHQYLKLVGDIILAATNVGLNLLMIPQWGLMGAAIATGISILAVNLLRILQVQLVLNMHGFNWSYLKAIGAGAIATVISLVINSRMIAVSSPINILITTAVIIAIYIPLLLIMGLEKSDQLVLRKVQQKVTYHKH